MGAVPCTGMERLEVTVAGVRLLSVTVKVGELMPIESTIARVRILFFGVSGPGGTLEGMAARERFSDVS